MLMLEEVFPLSSKIRISVDHKKLEFLSEPS
jgi:hypothetical protein